MKADPDRLTRRGQHGALDAPVSVPRTNPVPTHEQSPCVVVATSYAMATARLPQRQPDSTCQGLGLPSGGSALSPLRLLHVADQAPGQSVQGCGRQAVSVRPEPRSAAPGAERDTGAAERARRAAGPPGSPPAPEAAKRPSWEPRKQLCRDPGKRL